MKPRLTSLRPTLGLVLIGGLLGYVGPPVARVAAAAVTEAVIYVGTPASRTSLSATSNNLDINVKRSGGTAITAGAAAADAVANPTTGYEQTLPLLFNGTTWDRQRSGSATSTDPHFGASLVVNAGGVFTLQASTTKAATFSGTAKTGLGTFNTVIVTWDIASAERDSANETYDLYVTSGDGVSSWDVAHFPQIATTGAKRYTAFIYGLSGNYPQEVTTATPGVAAVASGTFKTDTAGSGEGIKTLGAGKARHGVLGDRLNYELVIAGTVATGIQYSLTATVK